MITLNVTRRPGNSLVAQKVISYRAVGSEGRGRVAVTVELRNTGTVAWTPTGAALVGVNQEALTGLTVWPLEPIPPGKFQSITVELDAAESEARGTYTLKLWGEQGGVASVTFDGVTFP